MLGDGQPLVWTASPDGLVVELPTEPPCEHAYTLKIVLK
jgi:hypothetical protein